jgi:hypothetical protein
MNTLTIALMTVIVVLCYVIPLKQAKQGSGTDEERRRIKFRSGLAALVAFIPLGYIDLASRQINGFVNMQSLTSVLFKYIIIWLACIFVFIPFALRRGTST